MTVADPASRSQAPTQPFPDPIPGILSFGSLNILAGAAGVGKTCLLSTLLRGLRDGAPTFGLALQAPPAIGFVCADRGEGTATHWLTRAGYPDIRRYSLTDDLKFIPMRLRNKLQLVQILGECLDRLGLPPGSLAVIDPLALFLGGNLNDYQACAVACLEIRREIVKRQLTIIGTAHAGKQKSDRKEQYRRLQDRILGSAAQLGYGDTQMYLAAPEETDEEFYSFLLHPHTAPSQILKLDRDPSTGLFIPWDSTKQDAEAKIVYEKIPVSEEGIGFGELVSACAGVVSRASIHRLLQRWTAERVVFKVGYGRYRRLAQAG